MDCKMIGALLKQERGEKTRKEVARSIGVSVAAVRHYEAGNRIPKDEIKYKLSKVYQKPVQELFFQDIFFKQ